MSMSVILLNQVIVVLLIIILGYFLTKIKYLDDNSTKKLTNILLMVATPSMIIKAFQKEFDYAYLKNFGLAILLSILVHVFAMICAKLFFKNDGGKRYKVNRFCAIYSNAGFMGIPLLSAVLGQDGVFYGSAYLVVLTILYWTHGIYIYTEDKKQLSIKKIILNPGVISTVLGLLFFFANYKLPYVVDQTVTHLANMNTPLAMLVLGKYLTEVEFKKVFKEKGIYLACFVRLVFIPVVVALVLRILGIDKTVSSAVLVTASCPVAVVTTLFANKYNSDAPYSSQIVSISTILSIITIPLVFLIL